MSSRDGNWCCAKCSRRERLARRFDLLDCVIDSTFLERESRAGNTEMKMQALVTIPTDAAYDPLRRTIETALWDHSIEPVFPDRLVTAGGTWLRPVAGAIPTADLIVTDVSRANPNMLWELGFATGLRKPILLLWNMTSGADLPP